MNALDLYTLLEPTITNGMSEFQMKYFAIDDQLTPFRKVRQALIEAKARMETCAMAKLELEEAEVKRDIEHEKFMAALDKNEEKLAAIRQRRHEYEIDRKKAQIAQLETESGFFLDTVKTLAAHFGGEEKLIELMKSKEFQLEKETEFWKEKFTRSVLSDMVNYGTITKGLFESISCLPQVQQDDIMKAAIEKQDSYQRYLSNFRDTILALRD